MIKKSQRIKTLVGIKAAQEKSALEALAAAQKKLSATKAQMDSLNDYRQEYQDRFNQLGCTGVGVMQALEFRSFMAKLDKAIVDQQQALEACETSLMAHRKIWAGKHQQTESLQKVCNAAAATELKQDAKREQVEQDERASRSGRSYG
jgi:flagellar FliJ protein